VHCVIIDFSKAFDTVNHEILLKTITTVVNPWQYIELDCFFSDRSQATRVNGVCSLPLAITRSIVQGSVTGLYAFNAYVSDCKTRSLLNFILKYADDFYLLVPENSDVPIEEEMQHIMSWSATNKLSINLSKCKELVFWRPVLKSEYLPCLIPDVVRVTCCKLLGIFMDSNLRFPEQVDQLIKICSQRFYLLQQMRKQALDARCLHVVLQSIVIHKIRYALPAWGGYISQEGISRISKLLKRAKRYGFTDTLHTFNKLLEEADCQLFSRTVCTNHCLHHLFQPDKSELSMSLRPRGHSFDLPRYKYDLTRKSFVFRNLYGQR